MEFSQGEIALIREALEALQDDYQRLVRKYQKYQQYETTRREFSEVVDEIGLLLAKLEADA